MIHRSLKDKIADGINVVVLALIAAVMLFPFIKIFATSFVTTKQFLTESIILWPDEWVTRAYEYIFSSDLFLNSIGNSIFITVVGTLVNLILTSMMAYGLTRGVVGQKPILFLALFTILFQAGLIPTYLVVQQTGLLNSLWSLILPLAVNPFNLLVMRQFFLNVPNELHESATLDGASEFQIFGRIILPLSKPVLAAIGLFYAVFHWNNYFQGVLYITDPQKWPVQVVLREIVSGQASMTLQVQAMMADPPPPQTVQMAAILVATVPILIVYPFLQKHFVKGVMLGSVKG